jgi:hypothetical protein
MIRTAAEELHSLARDLRRGRLLALTGLTAAIAVAGLPSGLPPVAIALAILLALGAAHWRRPTVDAGAVARHLDRVHPTLEESATLLLAPPGGLSAVERIQRARAEAAFDAIPRPITLPTRSTRILWGITALLVLVGGVRSLVSNAVLMDPLLPGSDRRAESSGPSLRRLKLTVTPPAYLGGRAVVTEGDADAPEGARLVLSAEVVNAEAAWIVTTEGDSLPLSGDIVRAAERTLLYQVVMVRDTFRLSSAWHRITVHPDRPPLLTVVRPEERTTLPVTPPWRVPVEILASDDHGIAEVRLLATITTGSGEGVRFREDTLPFTSRRSRANGVTLEAELDLAALGMGPGDEIYLSAQAFDGRRPEPNEGRSATLFISITDTTEVVEGEFDGLAIDRMPDYFRSQRQIIIDTEKLLADRGRISDAEFKRRSNDIGIDQQLLRLRYSEVAGGEESEEPADPMSGREHAAAEPEDPNAAAVADPNARAQADLTEGQRHSHDIVENATLLAMSTKELLQRALGEMWQAELQLRTYKPDSALPYEMRSLEYLEAVRQAARSYVKRVGLEPPPLEPDRKRLTGDLAGAAAPRRSALRMRVYPLPAIRAVLAGTRDRVVLEAAGREVAMLVVAEPGRHLETLHAVQEVSDAIAAGRSCVECEVRMQAGLLAALPPPARTAAGRTPTSPLSDAYLGRMTRP